MHRIFQTHHIPPHELYAMDKRHKAFIYASESLVMEAEEKERKKAGKGGK